MSGFAATVPFFFPGVVISIGLGLLFAPMAARALAARTSVVFLVILSVGIVLGATMTPIAGALGGGTSTGACDLGRFGWAPIQEYLRPSDASLNVLLFVPLGFSIGLLPRRARVLVLSGALALPFLVEMSQLLLPMLGRGCESADIVDNLSGLFLGLGCGIALTLIAGARSRTRRVSVDDASRP